MRRGYFAPVAVAVLACTSVMAAESEVAAILLSPTSGTPDQVTISDSGERASERGKWQGNWRDPKSGSLVSGEYFAHWVKKDGAWLTLAEVCVTLHCSGPICAP